jgi:7-cyano-7-deazaguanine synthase
MSEAERAVVLVSGGMDSCVTLALAAREREPAVLHASYGQRGAERERQAFRALADHYAVSPSLRLEIDLSHLGVIGGSSLTDPGRPIEEGDPGKGIPGTYVPFRNAHLLAAGVSWAEVLGAPEVHLGAVEEDSSGYPDCREAFLRAYEAAAREGIRPGTPIRLVAPLLHLGKGAIVRRAIELGAPLEKTWSCYRGQTLACGRCESCRLRLKGFREAGVSDPLPYAPSSGGAG